MTLLFSALVFWIFLALTSYTEAMNLPIQEVTLFVLGGILAPGLVRPFYFLGVERIGPALATSLGSVSPFCILIPAILFLGEKITTPIVIGIILIVAGIVVL